MLIKCPECELQVSDKASSCPHCGYPLKQNVIRIMRKTNKRRRLPNGFGQISEIKNSNLRNPFRAMITTGKTESGRHICQPLKPESYFKTYNDAYLALVNYNKNPYDLNQTITIQELYDKWTNEYFESLKNPKSVTAVEDAWDYCSSIHDMRAMDIRARHIKGCMDDGEIIAKGRKKHPTANMKNRIKSLFNLMFDYALEYEIVDRNYARSFTLSDDVLKEIGTIKNEHIPFTPSEMNTLWHNVRIKQYVDIVIVQCYSGWRPQELGNIELENVDLENWTFKGGMKTTSGIDRLVPIHSKIQKIIFEKYQEALTLGSKYLFNYSKDVKNSKFTYFRYKDCFNKIVNDLKLNEAHRPHDGRIHFVTTAKKFDVDEYAIKYMVGHKISDITEKVYTKREFEWLKNEIEKIK